MWEIFLALEIVGDVLVCCEHFNDIAFRGHASRVAESLNLLTHDVGTLAPYQREDGLDVFGHVHGALNIFVNALLPDIHFSCSSSLRQFIWFLRLDDYEVFNS
jgi:hypothetical protein